MKGEMEGEFVFSYMKRKIDFFLKMSGPVRG